MQSLSEQKRRKAEASGRPVRLANGEKWLLAVPEFGIFPDSVTRPPIDGIVDRIYEEAASSGEISSLRIWEAARVLLISNYDLADTEVEDLLSVPPGPACQMLLRDVLSLLFTEDHAEKTYSRWISASLLANGLESTVIPARDIASVMGILVATGRTIPFSRFSDTCRQIEEQERLEALV